MNAKFSMDDYVDVAERIREFSTRYPEGSLQGRIEFVDGGVLCVARAYRSADDNRPGVGHAFEPIPGKTPYTKDSEVMNAETSAWGRAIVALGFETKKIASRQEVAARTSTGGAGAGSTGKGERSGGYAARADASSSPVAPVTSEVAAAEPSSPGWDSGSASPSPFSPPPGAVGDGHGFASSRADAPIEGTQDERNRAAAGRVKVLFGKNAQKTLAELAPKQRKWYAEQWTPDTDKFPLKESDRALRMAARVLCGLEPFETEGPFAAAPVGGGDDDSIPFQRTFA